MAYSGYTHRTGSTGYRHGFRTGREADQFDAETAALAAMPVATPRMAYGSGYDQVQGAARQMQQDDFNRFLALENLAAANRTRALNERRLNTADERANRKLDQDFEIADLDRQLKARDIGSKVGYREGTLSQRALDETGRNSRFDAGLDFKTGVQDEKSNKLQADIDSINEAFGSSYRDATDSYLAINQWQKALEANQARLRKGLGDGRLAIEGGEIVPVKVPQVDKDGKPTGMFTVADGARQEAYDLSDKLNGIGAELDRLQRIHDEAKAEMRRVQASGRRLGVGFQLPNDTPWLRTGGVNAETALPQTIPGTTVIQPAPAARGRLVWKGGRLVPSP